MSTADSVNPNVSMTETQTSTNGKIELNSGSGPLTFDELEQVTRDSKKAKQQAKKEESKDLTSDTDKGGKKEVKEPKEPKEEPSQKSEKKLDEAKQEKQNEANLEKARKLIKAKYQDKELELDEESVIPVKINGKEELVQVKDLMSNYSGKVAWDKKFTEQSKREKEVKALEMRAKQASYVLKATLEEKDPTIRMFKMAQMAGVDPVTYRNNFLNENLNLLEKWYSMSDDERKADALAYEAQYHKHRADTLESSTKQQQAQAEQQQKLEQIRASHQISEDEYSEAVDQVEQAIEKGLADDSFKQPEKLVEYVQKNRIWKAIEASLDQVKLPWPENEVNRKLFELIDDAYNIKLTPDQVANYIVEAFGSNKDQKRVDQIKQERQEFLTGKKEVQQTKVKKEEPMFFDEII